MNGPVPEAAPAPAAAASLGRAVLKIVYRDGAGVLHTDWPPEKIAAALEDPHGLAWVDIQGPDEHHDDGTDAWLTSVFDFHPLAVEDALRECHIPKVDDWGAYLYIVFHVARIEPGTDALRLDELDVFLGRRYLVTYHVGPMAILDHDRQNIERDPRDRLRHGADHLLYRFLELAIDQSLEAIEELDDRVDAVQNDVLASANPKTLHRIFRIKRSAIRLHKTLGPQREVLNRLARDPFAPVQAKHRVYFRDLYDHAVRIHDISESLRDLIAGTLETYLSVISNRTNDIMKTLTIVTVMFMPMSFLVGFFGMNFFGEALGLPWRMPRVALFIASCVFMAISPCFIWIYARRKKWF
jgi:magnesium transporter